jgi:CBS domain-containing protein
VNFHLNLSTEPVERAHPVAPVCIDVEATAAEAMASLQREERGCCLVCRDGRLVGVFTERDAIRLMSQAGSLDVPIDQVMSSEPVALSATETVGDAIAKMSHGGFRQLPIVDLEGRPIGVLKVSGILHYMVEHFPEVVYNLPPLPHHSTQQREGA